MKRLVAKRNLKRKCAVCNRAIYKGNVYYKIRNLFIEDKIYTTEYILCPKCKRKEDESRRRFEKFKKNCKHPAWAIRIHYDYIPGEYVKEPQYLYCSLCGKII